MSLSEREINMARSDEIVIPRSRLRFIIWSSIFGTALGLGGTVFSLTLPPEPFTRAIIVGPFVALMLSLNKLVVFRPLSCTFMMAIASVIAIFTFYLGPPNVYKPLFILAGFGFDVGTFFRTDRLKYPNLLLGYVVYTLLAAPIFLLTLYLIDPSIELPVRQVIHYAVLVFWALAVPISAIVWRLASPSNPTELVARIRQQVSARQDNQ